jgi:hypothetical protein
MISITLLLVFMVCFYLDREHRGEKLELPFPVLIATLFVDLLLGFAFIDFLKN